MHTPRELETLLQPGEAVVWSGRPSIGGAVFVCVTTLLSRLAFAAFLTLFSLTVFSQLGVSPDDVIGQEDGITRALFIIVALFVAMGVITALLSVPRILFNLVRDLGATYGITDRRLIISSRWPWPFTASRALGSYRTVLRRGGNILIDPASPKSFMTDDRSAVLVMTSDAEEAERRLSAAMSERSSG